VNGTRRVLEWMVAQGHRPDHCLLGEPSSTARLGDAIKIGRRGAWTADLVVEGVQGHTAYPHKADNAAHRMVAMLAALLATPLDEGTAHFQPSDLQIASIDIGNPSPNVIPARARAVLNARFNDSYTAESLTAEIKRRLAGAGGRFALEVRRAAESFLCPPGPFQELVAAAVAARTGTTPAATTFGGMSDASRIQHVCPVVELGLVGAGMHEIDESVPLADLRALTAIYGEILARYFADPPAPAGEGK